MPSGVVVQRASRIRAIYPMPSGELAGERAHPGQAAADGGGRTQTDDLGAAPAVNGGVVHGEPPMLGVRMKKEKAAGAARAHGPIP
jgi:hypothetical protein